MARTQVAGIGMAVMLAGCASGVQTRAADGGETPPEADASTRAPDAGFRDDGEGPLDDAGPALADAATEDAGACDCVHGSCEAGLCTCEAGYDGVRCDAPRFAGTGRDGTAILEGVVDLTRANSGSRSCADGGDAVSYGVVALPDGHSLRLAQAPAPGCLADGDELLLLNLQGTPASAMNVGRWESVSIAHVEGDLVTLAAERTVRLGASADDGVGLGRAEQRVVAQRVPHYDSLTVPSGSVLTARAWDGVGGGLLALRVRNRLLVGGRIDMVGRGYTGGASTLEVNTGGLAGEGLRGLGARSRDENLGGGGGGAGDTQCDSLGFAGAGGGHATWGGDGSRTTCAGHAGASYGDVERLAFGAGGGAGGTDNQLSDNPPGGFGGAGGGAIFVAARELLLYGHIDAGGSAGQGDVNECGGASTTECWDYAGPGGGGAGGTVALEVESARFDEGAVRALGGAGGNGVDGAAGNGGAGGEGRIVLTLHGASAPAATEPPATLR